MGGSKPLELRSALAPGAWNRALPLIPGFSAPPPAELKARRSEKFLGERRGWLDEPVIRTSPGNHPVEDLQEPLTLYQQLGPADRKKLLALGQVLLD